MPQILRIGPYSIYFWSNEGDPLEPIYVQISEGRASAIATMDYQYWKNYSQQ